MAVVYSFTFCILFHFKNIQHFVYLLMEILDCLQFGAFMNHASLNICVQIFVWLQVLNCVNYIPRNRTAGSYGNFFL